MNYVLPNMSSKRGQNALIGGTIAMVTVVVLLFVSILLVSKVRGSIDRTSAGGFTAEDNTTFDNVVSNANTAFTLMAVALIVLVAFLIISILRGT